MLKATNEKLKMAELTDFEGKPFEREFLIILFIGRFRCAFKICFLQKIILIIWLTMREKNRKIINKKKKLK